MVQSAQGRVRAVPACSDDPPHRAVGSLDGERLQRVPRGFSKDHEAADYLKFRQFLAGCEFPASFATSPRFYGGVVRVFRQVAPLIAFLNEPLINNDTVRLKADT